MCAFIVISLLIQIDAADELSSLLERATPVHAKEVRLAALEELKEAGTKDPERTCAALAPYAREEDPEIRREAVIALGLSAAGRIACPLPVVQALHDQDRKVRHNAAICLGLYKEYPTEAAPFLFAAVKSEDQIVRNSIPFALRDAFGKTPKVLETLEQMFTDSELGVRYNAHLVYFQLTGDLDLYVPHLLRITADSERRPEEQSNVEKDRTQPVELFQVVGASRLYELTRERPDGLAKALVANLAQPEPALRLCALRHLRAMCVSSKSSFRAVERLKPHAKLEAMAANDPNEKVRSRAGRLHEILGEGPPKAAPEKLEPLEWPPPALVQPELQ